MLKNRVRLTVGGNGLEEGSKLVDQLKAARTCQIVFVRRGDRYPGPIGWVADDPENSLRITANRGIDEDSEMHLEDIFATFLGLSTRSRAILKECTASSLVSVDVVEGAPDTAPSVYLTEDQVSILSSMNGEVQVDVLHFGVGERVEAK